MTPGLIRQSRLTDGTHKMSLRELLTILGLIVAVWLPGAFIVSLRGKRLRDDPLEFSFMGLAFGILIFGWLALLLAEVGYFSLGRLGALWGGLLIVLVTLNWYRYRRFRSNLAPASPWRFKRWELAALALWLPVACWLFFRPHEFIVGGADAGVYVNLGASIAQTGGILIHDSLLADLDPALYRALLRPLPPSEMAPFYIFPGFFVPGTTDGLIIPQFYPLHPVWQAIAYALGGVRVELLMTPLWGLLGALAVYFTMRRLWGWRAALLAIAALSVTALQAWFARYPTTEMLTQYLLWTGAWALIAWIDKQEPRGLWAALAGAALGQVFLTRIDAYALLLAPVLVGLWLRRTHDWRRPDTWFFGLFTLLAAHSLLHGALFSGPYFYGLFGYSFRLLARFTGPLLGLGGLILAAWALARLRPLTFRRLSAWIGARRQTWAVGAALLVVIAAVYGYFVRPYLGEVRVSAYWYGGGAIPNLDHENLLRLGWYLGPAGIALSAAGTGWLLIKEANRRTAFLLGTGLFFSFFYLWRIQANPHQIYTMRRYVPVVLPFFVMTATYLINWFYAHVKSQKRWWGVVGLTVVWLSGIVWGARGFVSQVDYRGLIGQTAHFAAELPPRSVIIVGDTSPVGIGDLLGTPLRFLYGHDVLSLRDPGALDRERFARTIQAWQQAGRHVYWASVSGGPQWPLAGSTLASPETYSFDTWVLENVYDHKPTALAAINWRLSLAEVRSDQ
jgi:hypothetical protein